MQTTNNHNVVVRIVNSCLYFYLNFVNILNIYMFITVGIVYATRYTNTNLINDIMFTNSFEKYYIERAVGS